MGTQSRFQLTVLGIAAAVMISAFMQKQKKEGNESKTAAKGRDCSSLVGKIVIEERDIQKNKDIFEYLQANKLSYSWGYIVDFSSVKVLILDVPKGKEDLWISDIKDHFPVLSPKIAKTGYRIGIKDDDWEYPLGSIEINGLTPEVERYLEKNNLPKLVGFGGDATYAVPCGEEEAWIKQINSAGFKPPAKAFLGIVIMLY